MSLVIVTVAVAIRSGSVGAEQFKPRIVMRKSLPSIRNAPFVSAEEANLHESELVLGVVIDGHARAYPINMLTGPSREIINDTVARQPIAATW